MCADALQTMEVGDSQAGTEDLLSMAIIRLSIFSLAEDVYGCACQRAHARGISPWVPCFSAQLATSGYICTDFF